MNEALVAFAAMLLLAFARLPIAFDMTRVSVFSRETGLRL